MNKRGIISSCVITALIIGSCTLINSSLAIFSSSDKVINKCTTGDVNIEINENFKPPTNWDGKKYDKEVMIENLSNSECFIRVAIFPRWIDKNENPWPGDVEFTKISFVNISDVSENGSGNWIRDNEYYYYNKIISKGTSTDKIIESVTVDIPESLKSRYKDKTLVVDVKAEAVQASKDAYKRVWSDLKNDKIESMLNSQCKF